jgi:alpha-glucuronidase
VWEELVFRYRDGARAARQLASQWKALEGEVDGERHRAVSSKLRQQVEEAAGWSEKCLRYFQRFSRRPLPDAPREERESR